MHVFKNRSAKLLCLFLILILSSLSLVPIFAQGNTVITIAIDEYQQNFFNDDSFEAFEEAHPGVDVVTVIISGEERYFGAPQELDEVEEFLENVSNLAEQADLLPLDYFNSPLLRTRAGVYLDINPLLNADSDANLEDFYPAMLESLQWDGGTWGLPVSGNVQILTYDKNKFDEAGLAYPDSSWTLDDFIHAGEVLSEFDNEGNLLIPGFFGFDTGLLFATVTGDLSDPATFPSRPLLNTPENVVLVDQWATYDAEYSPDFSSGMNFDFNEVPLSINGTYMLIDEFNAAPAGADIQGALLPGNRAGLQVQAYAISAGTSNPQLAYELLQYMTSTPEIAYSFFGDTLARPSLADADTGDIPIYRPALSEDVQALVDEALENPISIRELHFAGYLSAATWRVNSEENPVDAQTALLELQEDLNEVYDAVEQASATSVIEVATPVPTPVLQTGEISLTFGLELNFSPGADHDLWQVAIDDFVTQDSQVGQIVLNTEFLSPDERVEQQDCFYLSSNPVLTGDLSQFFSLDPFLTTDINLDPANFVNGTLDQVTRDNMLWAIPMSLSPQVLWYNPERFEEAGLPEPANDWTIFEFVDALNALGEVSDGEPYRSQSFAGTYLYMLFAAYGGQPIDYSTNPYTFNLSDPTNVESIRQVLALIEDGLIDYEALAGFGGGGFGGGDGAIYDSFLAPDDYRLQSRGEEFGNPSRVVMFPRGVDYVPVTYTLGTGLISSNTPAPDACYRWLSFLSRRTELINGMPAQIDLFENAVAEINDADDVVALYNAFNEALASPSVLIIPSPFSNSSSDPVSSTLNFLSQNWVNQAFDGVVLEDADLETALADATQHITDFATCTDGIDRVDNILLLSDEEQGDYFEQFLRCAVDVDPSLEEMFGSALSDDDE